MINESGQSTKYERFDDDAQREATKRSWMQYLAVGGVVVLIMTVILIIVFQTKDDPDRTLINTSGVLDNFLNGANDTEVVVGNWKICDFKEISYDTDMEILVDNVPQKPLELANDRLWAGRVCDTNHHAFFSISKEEGLMGELESDLHNVVFSRVSNQQSRFEYVEKFRGFGDLHNAEIQAEYDLWRQIVDDWKKNNTRRALSLPRWGSQVINIQYVVGSDMVRRMGQTRAGQYVSELTAVLNSRLYNRLGFRLHVNRLNFQTSSYADGTTIAHLRKLKSWGDQQKWWTKGDHLLHFVTTRRLGGGVAYLGGLYWRDRSNRQSYQYGVSADFRGNLNQWDVYVLAHELGHNFGGDHTHELKPPVDQCGIRCLRGTPRDMRGVRGSIMSYCHLCNGVGAIDEVWATRTVDQFTDAWRMGRRAVQTTSG